MESLDNPLCPGGMTLWTDNSMSLYASVQTARRGTAGCSGGAKCVWRNYSLLVPLVWVHPVPWVISEILEKQYIKNILVKEV